MSAGLRSGRNCIINSARVACGNLVQAESNGQACLNIDEAQPRLSKSIKILFKISQFIKDLLRFAGPSGSRSVASTLWFPPVRAAKSQNRNYDTVSLCIFDLVLLDLLRCASLALRAPVRSRALRGCNPAGLSISIYNAHISDCKSLYSNAVGLQIRPNGCVRLAPLVLS